MHVSRKLVVPTIWALSLIVAASGTAFAAAKITGANIVDGTVTSLDIKNGSIATGDLNPKTRAALVKEAVKRSANSTPSSANAPGAAGSNGKDGANGKDGVNGTNGLDAYTSVDATSFASSGFDAYHYINGNVTNGFATDKIAFTGDGIRFGSFIDGLAAGAGIKFHGLDGKPLADLTSAAYDMSYIADNEAGKVNGAEYFRIGVKLANGDTDVLVVTAPAVAGPVLTHLPLQNKMRSSGNGGADNNGIYSSFAEVLADPDFAGATINPAYSIRLNLGATNGVNLTGVLRSFEINDTTYRFHG